MEKRGSSPVARRILRRPELVLGLALFFILLNLEYIYSSWPILERRGRYIEANVYHSNTFNEGLCQCFADKRLPKQYEVPPTQDRANPRWNLKSGQSAQLLITNASLFDGTSFLEDPVDILIDSGVITSVTSTATESIELDENVVVVNAAKRYVTPGLVDMHSHHLAGVWPALASNEDANEVNEDTGPLTPMVRVLDGMKAYDPAATIIASGGVTTSLILPGSANIMGGEAYPVKNILRSGPDGEEVVEEMLLEHGIPQLERRRYMKMACGENPKRVYDHTRMGNAWKLREQMAKGKDLQAKQDSWCVSAAAARESADMAAINELAKSGYPKELALDSTVAMLRGQVNVNIHCYEPEDLEDMLRHNEEFNFSIAAFHHAIEAWKVPELIKSSAL